MRTSLERTSKTDQLEQTVESVCRTIQGTPGITAIHVVLDHRPTYGELLRCRLCAAANGLALSVIGSGGVVVRQDRRPQGAGEACEEQATNHERRG